MRRARKTPTACALGLFFIGLSVAGCCGQKAPSPEVLANTTLLTGDACFTDATGSVVFASTYGKFGIWDTDSGRLQSYPPKSEGVSARAIRAVPGSDLVLVGASRSFQTEFNTPDLERQLFLFRAHNGEFGKSFVVPDGPDLLCSLTPELAALWCWKDADGERGSGEIRVFRCGPTELKTVAVFSLPGYTFCDMRRAGNDLLLLHVRQSTDKEARRDVDSELVLFEVSSQKVLQRTKSAVRIVGHTSMQVSRNGDFAAVYGGGVFELRRLPSLELVKRRTLGERFRSPWEAAVSSDGRYVGLGFAFVALWDTSADEVHVLDTLNEKFVMAPLGPEPLGALPARMRYCVSAVEFRGNPEELRLVTHDGWYMTWNPASRERIKKVCIAEVYYPAASAGCAQDDQR